MKTQLTSIGDTAKGVSGALDGMREMILATRRGGRDGAASGAGGGSPRLNLGCATHRASRCHIARQCKCVVRGAL